MSPTRAPLLSSRLTGRQARVLNLLTGTAIALGLADLIVLAGPRLAAPTIGPTVLPLATGAVASGLAVTRLLWSRGDRMLWVLLTIGLVSTMAGGVLSALTGNHVDQAGLPDLFW